MARIVYCKDMNKLFETDDLDNLTKKNVDVSKLVSDILSDTLNNDFEIPAKVINKDSVVNGYVLDNYSIPYLIYNAFNDNEFLKTVRAMCLLRYSMRIAAMYIPNIIKPMKIVNIATSNNLQYMSFSEILERRFDKKTNTINIINSTTLLSNLFFPLIYSWDIINMLPIIEFAPSGESDLICLINKACFDEDKIDDIVEFIKSYKGQFKELIPELAFTFKTKPMTQAVSSGFNYIFVEDGVLDEKNNS